MHITNSSGTYYSRLKAFNVAWVIICVLTAASCVSCKLDHKMVTYRGVIFDETTGNPISGVGVSGTYAKKRKFAPFDPGTAGWSMYYWERKHYLKAVTTVCSLDVVTC